MVQKLNALAKVTFQEDLLPSFAISQRKIICLTDTFHEKDIGGYAFDEILYDAKFNFRKTGFHSEPEVHDMIQN